MKRKFIYYLPNIPNILSLNAYLKTDGSAWGWGYNNYGQLGDNSTNYKITPVAVCGNHTFCQISTSTYHSLGIDQNGKIWSWGLNDMGQLGDNTAVSKRTPIAVCGNHTFCKVSAGQKYSLAIDKNGQAWGWGYNAYRTLGDNSNTGQAESTPVAVCGNHTFCHIAGRESHSLAIDQNGKAWGWGYNIYGQLGDNTNIDKLTPVAVCGNHTFCQIVGGLFHSVALDKNGQAWGWGYNSNGQLGDNTVVSKRTPVAVLGATKTFCQIDSGSIFSLAIDQNGKAWGWGANYKGQLGDNTNIDKLTPVAVCGNHTLCQISGGYYHTLALDIHKRIWSWGSNVYADGSGLGINTNINYPNDLSDKIFSQISFTYQHISAIDKNGKAWGWGDNIYGQLGDNTIISKLTPVAVLGSTKTFCLIFASHRHTLSIDKNGKVWSWGYNSNGQLGDNTVVSKRTPVAVLGATKTFCQISGGYNNSMVLDKNGKAWSWGYNGYGQLGDNTIVSKRTPVAVLGAAKTFCKISGGYYHYTAIDKNGKAWSWGNNVYGQLGDNTIVSKRTPIAVLGAAKTFCQIYDGYHNSLAIDKNGKAWGWGYNGYGMLGDNSVTSRRTPVAVLGADKTFCKISVGQAHTLAVDKNGQAWSWGLNSMGQLGDSSATCRSTPVAVCGNHTFCQVNVGNSYSIAIDYNGKSWGWGGLAVITPPNYKTTPVAVCI